MSVVDHRIQGLVVRLSIILVLVLALAPASARKYSISAYCHKGKTVLGTRPRHGICAGPRKYLGRYVRIGGKRYRVEDRCGSGFDIWKPTRKACRQFGRRRMPVTIGGSFLKRHQHAQPHAHKRKR